jgi:hypothetical protein
MTMKTFTIEMTFDVPHYRQHTYEAGTLEEAIRLAREDHDWDDQKADFDCSSPERITGAWEGDEAYNGQDLAELHEPTQSSLIHDLWWFIENVNDETPDRTERFFALRERVRVQR